MSRRKAVSFELSLDHDLVSRDAVSANGRLPAASPPHENPLAKALAMISATIFIPGSSSFQFSSNRCAEMSGPFARASGAVIAERKTVATMPGSLVVALS
jgi:hypothetical protein